MATSQLGHYVRFTESALDALDPADTGMARRACGNANHLADQYAQRRIAWVGGPFVTVGDEPVPGQWYRLWTSHPFDLHVLPEGESYRCRLRLRVTSGDASDPATFRAVLSARGGGLAEAYRDGANVTDVTVTQATYTWEDPPELVYLDARLVAAAQESVSTVDSIGGEPRAPLWLRAQLSVWVEISDSASIAGLGGVQLDEYVIP